MRLRDLLLFAFLAFASSFLLFRPLADADLPTQIKLGELIIQSGGLLPGDPLTFTHLGESFSPSGWLGQVLFAASYMLGSWNFVQLVHVVLWCAALIVAALWAEREIKSESSDLSALALLGALLTSFLVGMSSATARPQSFAIFFFAVLLHSTTWRLNHLQLGFLAVMLLAWQNIHPSLSVGLVTLALIFLTSAGRKRLFPLLCLCGALQYATPMGGDVFTLSIVNKEISRDLLGVSEWLPALELGPAMYGFFGASAISLVFLLSFGGRPGCKLRWLLLSAVFFGLTMYAARFALFYSIVSMPLWMWLLNGVQSGALFTKRVEEIAPRYRLSPLLLLVPVLMFFVPGRPVLSRQSPWNCASTLKKALPVGNIFNYREWGGVLSFVGYPEWKVAIDGRLYMFSKDEWLRYNDTARGTIRLSNIEERENPDAFFLRESFHPSLIKELAENPGYLDVANEDGCRAFVRHR